VERSEHAPQAPQEGGATEERAPAVETTQQDPSPDTGGDSKSAEKTQNDGGTGGEGGRDDDDRYGSLADLVDQTRMAINDVADQVAAQGQQLEVLGRQGAGSGLHGRVAALEKQISAGSAKWDTSVPERLGNLEKQMETVSSPAPTKPRAGRGEASMQSLERDLADHTKHIQRLAGDLRQAQAAIDHLMGASKKAGEVDPEAFQAAVRALHSKAERSETASLKDALGEIKRYLRDQIVASGTTDDSHDALFGGKCLSCDRHNTKFANLNRVDLALERQKRDLVAQVHHALHDPKNQGEVQVVTLRSGRATATQGFGTRQVQSQAGTREYVARDLDMMMVGSHGGLGKSTSTPQLRRNRGLDRAFQGPAP